MDGASEDRLTRRRAVRLGRRRRGRGVYLRSSDFDYLVKRLASGQLSRRGALRAAGVGLAVAALRQADLARPAEGVALASGTPVASSDQLACSIASKNEVEVGGGWLCNQTYALCTTAACAPPEGDATTVSCPCVVLDGYSFGMKTCSERVPSGQNLISNFSTQNVNSGFNAMACPEDAPWANCLDYPCQLDAQNPALATCQCQLLEKGPSLIFGGRCNPESCTATIWSGAAPPGVLAQYTAAMGCVDQQVQPLTACPAATPSAAASPASA